MDAEKVLAYDKPFHIYAGDEPSPNKFHSGYDTELRAESMLRVLNEKAEKMEIKARYTVHPKAE